MCDAKALFRTEILDSIHFEESLKEIAEKFQIVSEHTASWEYWLNPVEEFIYISHWCERITGYTKEEFFRDPELLFKIVHPSDKSFLKAHMKSCKPTLATATIEFRIIKRSGEIAWINHTCQPVFNSEGKFLGRRASNRDITDYKEMELRLKEAEERWQFALEGSGDGVWDWNLLTNNVFYSRRYKAMLGYDEQEYGSTFEEWRKRVHPEDTEWVTKEHEKLINAKSSSISIEYRLKCKDGSFKWIFSRGKVMSRDENNKPTRIVGTHTDITDRKKAEETVMSIMMENKKLLNKTIEYDRMKTEFFSNISHEFKTPLNVILGTLQLQLLIVSEIPFDSIRSKFEAKLLLMKQNCYRLLRLINNLIDITKIDSGYFELELNNYDVIPIIRDISLSIKDYIEFKNISLEFKSNIESKIIACDPERIERIILNLLSNAIKFTNIGGKITVNVIDEGDQLLIVISDTGIGIPKNKIPGIFDRFSQVDKSLTRNHEGSGIGLSIVKSLVELHRGTVEVQSVYGRGSEFFLCLPVNGYNKEFTSIETKTDIEKNYVEKINIEFSDIYPHCKINSRA